MIDNNRLQTVCKEYCLSIHQIEQDVYEVENNDLRINIDKFMQELDDCIVLTDLSREYERDSRGISWTISNIYYIFTSYELAIEANSYLEKTRNKYGNNIVMERYRFDTKESIDTIYRQEELGKKP